MEHVESIQTGAKLQCDAGKAELNSVLASFCRNRFTLLDTALCAGSCATFASRSKRQLFVGFKDGTISCYDIDSSSHVGTLKGHSGPVLSLSSRVSKEQLISASLDNMVMWETKVSASTTAALPTAVICTRIP